MQLPKYLPWTAIVLGILWLAPAKQAWALAGTLDKPSIAIPSHGEGAAARRDSVCDDMLKVLNKHAKQFVSGRFINANTTMEFGGTTEQLNALLKELAEVAGAKLHIHFAKVADEVAVLQEEHPDPPAYQWRIQHSAWAGDAHSLSITIYLADGKIKVEDVQIPTIVGQKPAANDPTTENLAPAVERPGEKP